MATRRTVDLLPEIFRTDTNKQFFSATLDQLTQEPNLKRTQGYIGQRVGPGVNASDNYVSEPTPDRTNYQLEPGVVFLKPNTDRAEDAITYPGMVNALALQNADVERQDRLWQSEYYAWDPFCDLDKFTNYSQYYWLPEGPNAVDISATDIPLTDDFDITRSTVAYTFSGLPGNNPVITLARGGNYTFNVAQSGSKFWIQSAPGISGVLPESTNISSRNVLGVINNGADTGVVEFYVPQKTAQDFYYNLAQLDPVDLVSDLKFNQVNNMRLSTFLSMHPTGIDGITQLNNKTVIFSNTTQDAAAGGWEIINGSTVVPITVQSQRYSIWTIIYVEDIPGDPLITLERTTDVANLSKFTILYGTKYNSTQWYKDASGYYYQVPLLTAAQDVLWYQDGANPEIFGQIRLVDLNNAQPIDINQIIGAKSYTSPNGVVFTNGLKIQFRGPVNPAEYQNLEFYVEGVGTGPGINTRVGFVDGQAYFGDYHVVGTQKITGLPGSSTFQQFIYNTVEESLVNKGAGTPVGAPLPQTPVGGADIGNGIKLIAVTEMVTPETYTRNVLTPYDSVPYDVGAFDDSLNAPFVQDYLTMNRSSQDRNAWSRSNRWFHIDVINYAAQRNNDVPLINNSQRARRPIIEFRGNLRLWNMGTQAIEPVNVIDFDETDALSNINGQLSYGYDGYQFLDGTRVIFAADLDPNVRNRVYTVRLIDPTGSGALVIDLEPVPGGEANLLQTVVSLNGSTQQGISFWFDGVTWQQAQQKTNVNQAPLFDVYDADGRSFGDREVYPSSNFAGCRLFGYAEGGTSIIDSVLGLSLKYFSINNVGDILFENYLYTDTFIYVTDSSSTVLPVSQGFARQYIDKVSFSNQIGWQLAASPSRQRQVFRFEYTGDPLAMDVRANQTQLIAPVQLFTGSTFIDPTQYILTVTENSTTITLLDPPELGTIIEALIISDQVSTTAFYEVPMNLESNPLNGNSAEFTLGTIRSHYETIGQNLRSIVGPINGANNTRDLGDIVAYGTKIIQNSASLALAGVFLRKQQYELFNSLTYNSQEYSKYKSLLLDLAGRGDFVNLTPTQVLDVITQEISLARNEAFPFYWTDMLPTGETYSTISYTVTPTTTGTFDTTEIYDLTSSNYQALLVYLNDRILTLNLDYTVPEGSATIVVSTPLALNDVITIREYPTTYGSFVPNTPTKMGLYPAFRPRLFLDESYVNPTFVIQGHDGSVTVAFGDFRDQVLLEFETRIYNNLKIRSAVPLTAADVIPGQFRVTDYTLEEINSILLPDFLSWVGWNKLNYTSQSYLSDNPFTYNYSQSGDKLNQQPLLGAWRGIYNYFYDTISPNNTPWEMLGFSEQPTWWEEIYGPPPYTSGNLVLWHDLEAGFIADPVKPRFDARYARPGLTKVIPASSEGALLNPLDCVVGNFDAQSFRRSWTFGDDGPVESAWRTSSSWPFAVMRLLALTKPANFFNLFVDRDRYVFDDTIRQYLWDRRYRLVPDTIAPFNGSTNSRASYINWIIDYNKQRGLDSNADLSRQLDSIDVRLCWKLAAFSDKRYLKIFTERSTIGGSNTSLLLPDESYQLLLYQDPPFDQISYSSVVVQVVDDGWAVYGYNNFASYFEILQSRPQGLTVQVSAGGSTVPVSIEYTDTVVRVPYGFVFTNRAAVCDFLFSYGQLLSQRGMTFEGRENGYIMNWQQMAQEFLYWSNQGWTPGNGIINLNPGATRISVTRPGTVAETIFPSRLDSLVLNQNAAAIQPSNLVIGRLDNTFSIQSLNADTINFLKLRFTAYEHVLVLDNRSIFADLIYDPVTGARQSRVLVSGWISGDWNGTVNAPGFVLNQDNIQEWIPNRKYTKGEIVLFKDEYWSAVDIVQPSTEFNFNSWIKSDYQDIQRGLLPNAANASDQLAKSYSVYNANLEQEVDLFSYGLIGFRPRRYMQALNIGDVSQVQLYQQFLGSKGTRPSAELFTFADLGKEIAEYDIFEYWAILRSTYGANANRSYFELLLNQALLPSDPALIQVIESGQTSLADQTVFVDNIWKSSFKITDPNILSTTTITPDNALPSAGFVNLEDVDLTLFDFDSVAELNADLSNITVGTSIWVAKVNTYDWNVYQATKVPGTMISASDNLSDQSLVTFSQAHGLSVGDTIVIKYFDSLIDGVYKVLSVPGIYSAVIDYEFIGFQTSLTGNGLVLKLITSRVQQPADIALLPYAKQLQPGVRVWVNNTGDDRWGMLEKTDPFVSLPTILPTVPEVSSRFGAALSQGLFNLSALVGAPGYNPDNSATPPGAVYSYVRSDQNQYEQNSILELTAINTAGYGNAIDIGDQRWAVIGASESNNNQGYASTINVEPGSNFFDQRQILVAPDQDFNGGSFGYSVAISQNENWMYISSPDHGRVHAYTKIEVQPQAVSYETDGATVTYNWSDSIVIDPVNPEQILVLLNNEILQYPQDYAVSANNITLTAAPPARRTLTIVRRTGVQLDQKLITDVVPATNGSGTGAEFTVNNVRGNYTVNITSTGEDYVVGELLTIDQDSVATPDSVPPAPIVTTYTGSSGTTINVTDTTGILEGMTVAGNGFDSGQYVTAVTSGTDVIVSTLPDSTPSGSLTFSHDIKIVVTDVDPDGAITEFDYFGLGVTTNTVFPLERYLVTATDIYAFTVRVNNVLQRPHIDYDFNSDSTLLAYDLVFTSPPPAGAVILVDSNSHFSFVDTLTVPGLDAAAKFGHSVTCNTDGSIVIVGAPYVNDSPGRAYVFARSQQSFIVNDASQENYSTVQDLEIPGKIAVTVNGEFLTTTALNINGTFTVDVSDPGNQFVNITAPLSVGDVVQIDTNQFTLIEVIDSVDATDGAAFGWKVDQCVNDCSLYVSAPFDSTELQGAGRVEFLQNQSRVYGTITSLVANPVLTPGQYISINGIFIENTGTTVQQLVQDINAVAPPNAVASLTADLILEGDNATKTFDVGNIYSSASSYTTKVLIDDVEQISGVDYTYNNTTQQITFTVAPFNTATITVISGRIVLSVKNFDASIPLDRLQVLPGTGSLFGDIGFDIYVWQQTITSPVPQTEAHFGQGLFIGDNTVTLLVGAPNGSVILPTTFDGGETVFDSSSTVFSSTIDQSGVVYSYDALPAANSSKNNPLQFVFGQQFTNNTLQPVDQFGAALDYTTGVLLAGAPGSDLGDSSQAEFGQVFQFENANRDPAWKTIRRQQPVVNTALLNTVFMYDRVSGKPREYFDYFDPLQGRVLGVVEQNLDYIGAVDPAAYNVGLLNNYGMTWMQEHVGEIWWDTNQVRFIDPNQDDIVYASRRWGQTFPGSQIQLYQWIVSDVPPATYTGPGTPRNTESYVVSSSLDQQGFLTTQYYFWVTDISTVATNAGKTLSIDTIARYIESPRSSGIPYIAAVNPSTIAIYNGLSFISAQDTVLHIEYDRQATEAAVHVEYQLIAQNRPDAFLNDTLYKKFLDSMTGDDTAGNAVPDPFLAPSEKYGVQFRPRQSMVANRFLALQNYITQANTVLAQFPISEIRKFNLLNSSEPEPSLASGAWNKRVANLEELSYQNLQEVALGYKYLVGSDSSNNGLWTIYDLRSGALPGSRQLVLDRVQNYDTRRYWDYIDWYRPGYNQLQRIILEVPNRASLDTILVPEGSAVKVAANAVRKWEIYRLESGIWNRVGLEDGTIEISSVLWNYTAGRFGFDAEVFDAQYYDQAPIIETRRVLEAINQELLIDELLIERNRLLILMFNYILTEQEAPAWLTKTSLIDVDHTIRELLQFQIYRADNQDFVLDYINEIKPYHVQIREFNLKYQGVDQFLGSLTDFDLPAYYDTEQKLFVSPVLDNTGALSTTSSVPSTDPLWRTFPYDQWFNNYLLSIESVVIYSGGSGYISPPEVVVTGECQEPAVMTAQINSAGRVVAVNIISPGLGYTTTATITLVSNTGSGARALAVLGNSTVRNLKTIIKYDRYQYASSVQEWQANVIYAVGTQVRYLDRVWSANTTVSSAAFNPDNWTIVPAADLSGVDRTMGYYQPTVNEPGLDLAQLISGVVYPGVQVSAPLFSQNTGFDVGNFDVNPYDNLSISPEGFVTYDPEILDAIYTSNFVDPFLGTLPTSINVDGGAFVDTYESHAPEELVPGIAYDTLDLRVFTTPGDDWEGDGHGFPLAQRNFVFDSLVPQLDFSGMLDNTVTLMLYNQRTGVQMSLGLDYTVDWVNYRITVLANAVSGDVLTVTVYSIGGGNQLYVQSYVGNQIGDTVVIPIPVALIESLAVFVNGANTTNYTYTQDVVGSTRIDFGTEFTATDRVVIAALGSATQGQVSWSTPVTQYVVSDGSLTYLLVNDLQGTNPANLVVTKNGIRARGPEGIEHIGNGLSRNFRLPSNGNYNQALIANNDVAVYINNVPQTNGVDFFLDPDDGSTIRTVTFAVAPPPESLILITVRTIAQYWISGDQISFQPLQGFIPSLGEIISITSWNDTAQQNILTQLFVGPDQQGLLIAQAYDTTPYDIGTTSGAIGSFDFSTGTIVETNRFDTNRIIEDPERLIVSLNGRFLFYNEGYSVEGSVVTVIGPTINNSDSVVITSFAQDTVSKAMAFRIFQDMRGLQRTYRITPESTTTLTRSLSLTDDVIYVEDVGALDVPELEYGIFGILTINGERITYRNIDTDANTVSGLRRGTAGTAADTHAVGAAVYSMGIGNLLQSEYQNYVQEQNFIGDGSSTTFVATDISILDADSTERTEAVHVLVGGILQTSGYSVSLANPVAVEFDTAPQSGYQVSIRVDRGKTWYQPGTFTPSNGVPLQQTDTDAARFLRGLI